MRNRYLVILLLFIFSCHKHELLRDSIIVDCNHKSNEMDVVKNLIVAKYQWIKTHYSEIGLDTILTPLLSKRFEKYEFNNNGTVNYYENFLLKGSYNYTIDYAFKVSGFPSDSSVMVIATDKNSGRVKFHFDVYICNDTAILSNPFTAVSAIAYYKRYH
jgi:hypothetical protein